MEGAAGVVERAGVDIDFVDRFLAARVSEAESREFAAAGGGGRVYTVGDPEPAR